ncbi:MAG TPA: glutamate racemase [Candidatus Hydrogenedentes bacterium]|nr:glutamate racemase [Candidatus Hydrogenedentota bacterium]HOL76533.1 glutamate racemase [Candidatus Hydrogenedentota bacterium]HPO85197.1 glutamate racemase [Candidatus Hydrogenedentota bacterium]
MTDAKQAIGIFDSGVGGLTVLRSLERVLPNETIIYLGDTARVPYGTKSPETVIRYARACANLLVKLGIKLLVVACNTASAVAIETLEKELPVPVIGVIRPGASVAAATTRTGKIGVIGTPSTIRSGAYQKAIHALLPGAQVFAKGCPLFVPLAEEGWLDGPVVEQIAQIYLSDFSNHEIDTLVLGCTHYPLLRTVIAKTVGTEVTIVDSADTTSQAVQTLLDTIQLCNECSEKPRHRYLVTDSPERFQEVGERFLGRVLNNVEWIDF